MRKVFFIAMFSLFATVAQAKNDFVINVPVDVDAKDSVEAKDNAMLSAERKAFIEVAEKLTTPENVEKLNELSDEVLAHFIQSVSVANEKSGGTKYKADLTVQINEQLLKEYMAENEMIKTETSNILVIPVYKPEPETFPRLWEEDNLWRQNWRAKGLIKFGTMQITTADDKFRMIEGLNADSALYMNSNLAAKIAELNGSERVYVIYAEAMLNGDLKITLKNERNQSENSFSIYNDGNGNIFDKAIEKSVMFVANMERENPPADAKLAANSLNAVYIYQNMKDWLDTSQAIADLRSVEGVDTKSFGGGKVNFVIRYKGTLDDLWSSMLELGLSHENKGNYYVIR